VIAIRPVRPSDLPALSDLAQRTWLHAFGDSVSPETAGEEAASRSESSFAATDDTILVAEDDGAVVGYAQFDDSELHRLYVETALHGRGIGRTLLAAALEHPRLAGKPVTLQVWEENERAVRLYEDFGFRRAGTRSFTIGSGEHAEDIVMVLDRETGR
jgi:diamine N-acetyltransferase